MEGLALGVKSLFGHTIGGMSGAMSKITGTFGKGVAALTLDDEYQKKRRENLSKRQTAGEGFVESGKDLGNLRILVTQGFWPLIREH